MAEREERAGLLKRLFGVFLASINLPIIGIIALLILGAAGGIYAVKARPGTFGLNKSQAEVQKEVESLVSEVGNLIELPSDEQPTIATVTEVERVKDQPFFKNAKNGDKVLIYTNAKKAILYRPSEKRIVEVGAVNINQQQQEESEEEESPSPSPTPEEEESPSPSPTPEE